MWLLQGQVLGRVLQCFCVRRREQLMLFSGGMVNSGSSVLLKEAMLIC